MRVETALNHERRLKAYLHDIIFFAKHEGWTYHRILDERGKKIFGDSAWKRVPQWVRERLNERFAADMESIHRIVAYPGTSGIKNGMLDISEVPFVRWQLRIGEEHLTTDEVSRRREDGDETVWDRVEGAFIWNHKPEKAFSPWSHLNAV